jgi:bacterioferritin (cytochrome b1)
MNLCPQLMDALNNAFSRKYHSLAQYILDARPWVPAGREGALEPIRAAAAEDQQFADRLAAAIEEAEGVPQLAIYNPEVASLNYLSLDYLLNYLIKDLQGQLADFERAAAQAEGCETVKRTLAELAEATQKQVERLQAVCAA